jgi:hypothetical protein
MSESTPAAQPGERYPFHSANCAICGIGVITRSPHKRVLCDNHRRLNHLALNREYKKRGKNKTWDEVAGLEMPDWAHNQTGCNDRCQHWGFCRAAVAAGRPLWSMCEPGAEIIKVKTGELTPRENGQRERRLREKAEALA